MFRRLKSRLTFANVVSAIALFVALGGSSYALTVSGRNVRDNSLTSRDVRDNSLTGRDVRNRSLTGDDLRQGSITGGDIKDEALDTRDIRNLRRADFALGEEPRDGAPGAQGERGPQGLQGQPGIPSTDLPSGATLRGPFAAHATSGNDLTTAGFLTTQYLVTFALRLPSPPALHYLEVGDPATAECPGTAAAPEAAPGHFCAYERSAPGSSEFNNLVVPTDDPESGRLGARILATNSASTNITQIYGTWAVTAP